jgi:prepilin-type N-terminal cleavage/methylation domain-containing protein
MNRQHNKNCCRIHSTKHGFTLVEVLVAIMILAVGVLAVSQLTVMGSRTSTLMNRRMYARDVLNRYYEQFTGLPTHDSIFTRLTSSGLNDTIAPDYIVTEDTPGGRFRVMWNIADSMIDTVLDTRFKTIRVHVLWPQTQRPLISNLIKRY